MNKYMYKHMNIRLDYSVNVYMYIYCICHSNSLGDKKKNSHKSIQDALIHVDAM